MTADQARRKLLELYREWHEQIHLLSLKELKDHIKHSPKRAVLHELELNHRLNGGLPPIYTIAEKLAKDGNFHSVNIDANISFSVN